MYSQLFVNLDPNYLQFKFVSVSVQLFINNMYGMTLIFTIYLQDVEKIYLNLFEIKTIKLISK